METPLRRGLNSRRLGSRGARSWWNMTRNVCKRHRLVSALSPASHMRPQRLGIAAQGLAGNLSERAVLSLSLLYTSPTEHENQGPPLSYDEETLVLSESDQR